MEIPDIRGAKNINGKRILLRADLNVPIVDSKVIDDFRIRKSFETIQYLKQSGARTIIISHLSGDPSASLAPVAESLEEYTSVLFIEDLIQDDIREKLKNLKDGDVVLLENIRQHKGEEENSTVFAQFLASLADIYVNDGFAASHRNHASIVSVPALLPSYAGILFLKEIHALDRALEPKQQSLFILGGAKFETKEPLVRNMIDKYSEMFIGGALAHDFFKAKGITIGRSRISSSAQLDDLLSNERISFPVDAIVMTAGRALIKDIGDIGSEDTIVDAGPKTLELLRELVNDSAFILWNGPLGNYEKGFDEQTKALARLLSSCRAETIVGGGDTVAAISDLHLEEKFSFVSTGGGAMIGFLSDGTLPGIEALKEK